MVGFDDHFIVVCVTIAVLIFVELREFSRNVGRCVYYDTWALRVEFDAGRSL